MCVCVYIYEAWLICIYIPYMNTTSWSLLKDAVSITVLGFTPRFFWLMCWWNPLLKLKCDFFKVFSILCNVVWLPRALWSKSGRIVGHFYSPTTVRSTCFKVAQTNLSMICNYFRGKGVQACTHAHVVYICVSVKYSFLVKFWEIIFQSCGWKNMITFNNCFHRRQLAWFVWSKLSTGPPNGLVLLYFHWGSRGRSGKRVWSWRLFRYLFHQPTNPFLLFFRWIC